jgi:hypothetical protein
MAGKMKAYESAEFSMDIGTPGSLAVAQKKWLDMTHNDT